MSIDCNDLRVFLTPPIGFQRVFATVGGSATAGLFLSQLYYWSDKPDDPNGWVYKTAGEWYEETMLTRRELDTVRKALREKGLIEEKLAGVPAKTHYKIVWNNLFSALKAARGPVEKPRANRPGGKRQTRLAENAKLDRPIPPDQVGEKRQTIIDQRLPSENTTENTTMTGEARPSVKAPQSSSSFSGVKRKAKSRPTDSPSTPTVKPEVVVVRARSIGPKANLPPCGLSQDDPGELEKLATEFGLSSGQAPLLGDYVRNKGIGYVREKAAVARSKPRENLAAAFLAALRDDWQVAKSSIPQSAPEKPAQEPSGWQDWFKGRYPTATLPDGWEQVCNLFPGAPAELLAYQEERDPKGWRAWAKDTHPTVRLDQDRAQQPTDLLGQLGLGCRSCGHRSRPFLSWENLFRKNLSHTKYSDANEIAQVTAKISAAGGV